MNSCSCILSITYGVPRPRVCWNADRTYSEVIGMANASVRQPEAMKPGANAVKSSNPKRKASPKKTSVPSVPSAPTEVDFSIRRNRADAKWAEWIAWQLENEGYTTKLQDWDRGPGSNFVLQTQWAAAAKRTIAVLSPDYLHFTGVNLGCRERSGRGERHVPCGCVLPAGPLGPQRDRVSVPIPRATPPSDSC